MLDCHFISTTGAFIGYAYLQPVKHVMSQYYVVYSESKDLDLVFLYWVDSGHLSSAVLDVLFHICSCIWPVILIYIYISPLVWVFILLQIFFFNIDFQKFSCFLFCAQCFKTPLFFSVRNLKTVMWLFIMTTFCEFMSKV